MNNNKPKKRKPARSRRQNERLAKTRQPTATMTRYGRPAEVDYLGVVVHRGSEIIASRTFHARDYDSEAQAIDDAMEFIASHDGSAIHMVDEIATPAYCCDCGEPLLHVADRLPAGVASRSHSLSTASG
jgi:hypothetical protein